MIDMIFAHPHLFWLSLGGLLLAAEMLGGSGYLLWSGVAGVLFFFQTLQAPHRCAPEPDLTRFRSEIFPGNSLVAPQAPSQSVPQQTGAPSC